MSWYGNGLGSQYATIGDSDLVAYEAKDHAFGIWWRWHGDTNSSGGVIWDKFINPSGRHQLYVGNSDHATYPSQLTWFLSESDGTPSLRLTHATPLVIGQWYHIVLQRVGNTQYLYVDGVLSTSGDVSPIVVTNDTTEPMYLLKHKTGSNAKGYIADFFKYNRALTAGEITELAAGKRPTAFQGSAHDLAFIIAMDTDDFIDDYNRLKVTQFSAQSYPETHPEVYDDLPPVTRDNSYIHPTTRVRVEVTGGPYLDIMRHTPFGLQVEGPGNDCFNALDWAIRNQHIPDPANRTVRDSGGSNIPCVGGPPGSFMPIIGGNDVDFRYWNYTKPLWVPNGRGGSLQGVGMGYDGASSQQGRFSRIKYNPSAGYELFPAFIVTGGSWKFTDFTLCAYTQNETAVQRTIGFQTNLFRATTVVDGETVPADNTGHALYDPQYITIGDAPITELEFTNLAVYGFGTGIKVEDTSSAANNELFKFVKCRFKATGIGIHIYNEQSLDHYFEDCLDAEDVNIYFEAGGNVVIHAGPITDPDTTFLKLKNPGKFNGTFSIHKVAMDPRTYGRAYLLEVETSGVESRQQTINIFGGISQSAYGGTYPVGHPQAGESWVCTKFIKIGNNVNLNMWGFRGIGPIDITGGGAPPPGWNDKIFRPAVNFFGCEFLSEADALDPYNNFVLLDGVGPITDRVECQARGCKIMTTGNTVFTHFPQFTPDLPVGSGDGLDSAEVQALINVADYTTPAEAQALVDAADYTTPAEAQALVDAADWTINLPSGSITAISITGDSATSTLPKVGQPRVLNLNVAGIAAQSGNTVSDITQVRVRINQRRTTETVYNVSSIVKDSGDPATAVSLPSSTGVVTVSITVSDFGTNKLEAGWNYYVIPEVLIAGTWRESDVPQRLMFTYDQVN